jgi:hypothetical protein
MSMLITVLKNTTYMLNYLQQNLFEKLIVAQLVKKFITSCGPGRFIVYGTECKLLKGEFCFSAQWLLKLNLIKNVLRHVKYRIDNLCC